MTARGRPPRPAPANWANIHVFAREGRADRPTRGQPEILSEPPIRRRGKTPRARPPGKAAPRRFSSVAGAPGADSRPDRTSGRPRLDAALPIERPDTPEPRA